MILIAFLRKYAAYLGCCIMVLNNVTKFHENLFKTN